MCAAGLWIQRHQADHQAGLGDLPSAKLSRKEQGAREPGFLNSGQLGQGLSLADFLPLSPATWWWDLLNYLLSNVSKICPGNLGNAQPVGRVQWLGQRWSLRESNEIGEVRGDS